MAEQEKGRGKPVAIDHTAISESLSARLWRKLHLHGTTMRVGDITTFVRDAECGDQYGCGR